jgi:hypothetical protein
VGEVGARFIAVTVAESPSVSWYLRSLADADTHRGSYSTVTRSVHAVCGEEFVPIILTNGAPIMIWVPVDPAQICPECRRLPVWPCGERPSGGIFTVESAAPGRFAR